MKTVPASEAKSVASDLSSHPNFQLHSSKWFQNQLGSLQSVSYDIRTSTNHNGTLLATVMAKLIVMEGAIVTLLNTTEDIRERMKECPHGTRNEEDQNSKDGSAAQPDEGGDANGDDDNGRPFLGENTRYENNSRTFEVNIHNPTVHISTRGTTGGDEVNEKENVSGHLCFLRGLLV